MKSLTNRRILLGVTGGIAAYKAAELIRRLKDQHADVRVVMTEAAQEFITPLTLQALSGNAVHLSLLDTEAEAAMGHIELAKWADLILIAPASADFIARLCSGMANDLLTTLCLASEAPIALAPAMNQAMWADKQTQENMNKLQQRAMHIFGPGSGSQACGDIGLGRMLEADEITHLASQLFQSHILSGKHVVITAGPTREALDPVRYISNHSSGKMGYALAEAALNAGARVSLISGPVNLEEPERIKMLHVTSADDMLAASLTTAADADIFIGCAAVADYRPHDIAQQKIKKTGDEITLTLVKNPDIIASIAATEHKPFTVGFAAETQNLNNYAQAKLAKKNLDMIIANDVSNLNIGFNSEHNAATVFTKNTQKDFPICSKPLLASRLIEHIHQIMTHKH